jgi:DNA polymerase elongation subunit (family B)
MVNELKELTTKLNKSYDKFKKIFNIDKHWFKIKPEEIFSTLFMVMLKGGDRVAKKRYAGIISWEGKPKNELSITGFDRSDMSRVGNKVMKNVLELACMGRSNEEIANYVKEEVNNIHNHPLEEIGFSKGISKPLQTYKNQDWIRGARWTNLHSSMWGKPTAFGSGSKPKYVYVKENRLPKGFEPIEIVALDDDLTLPNDIVKSLDWETIVEKTIKYKIETILDAIGTSWDDIFSTTKVKGLMKYGKTTAT